MQDPQAPSRHTVDAPVGVAVVVADGDREPSIVGPDEVDDGTLAAADLQGLAFARVRRLVSGLWNEETVGLETKNTYTNFNVKYRWGGLTRR